MLPSIKSRRRWYGWTSRWVERLANRLRTWLFSFCVHAILILVLACMLIPADPGIRALVLNLGAPGQPDLGLQTLDTFDLATPSPAPTTASDNLPDTILPPLDLVADTTLQPVSSPSAPALQAKPLQPLMQPTDGWGTDAGLAGGASLGAIEGRRGRRGVALGLGASVESEAAVDKALAWLAAHQLSDGSWSFDLLGGRCGGQCRHSGDIQERNGATGLALLALLGAGHTQDDGTYRAAVSRALIFLIKTQQEDGSFWEPAGTMYSHGICALALCEAWAMSDHKGGESKARQQASVSPSALRRGAQRALGFLVTSQHGGGGWRYAPGQAGDTSVVAWQSMALRSGKMAGLTVPPRTFQGIDTFLDDVQGDDYGASYRYMIGHPIREGTTAAGLLCRLYAGWSRGNPAIVNGAEQLSAWGPSSNNIYYNYYATQVMHHFQGPLWERWNGELRDYLVDQQVQEGHEEGSWFFEDDFGSDAGGRLYITCMTAMTLEVYYRHMPIYSSDAVRRDTE